MKLKGRISRATIQPNTLNTAMLTDFSLFLNKNRVTGAAPYFDTSNGVDFKQMFLNSDEITSIPKYNTGKGTNFNGMFQQCEKLTTIPLLDTSKGTDFATMFRNCSELESIPKLNTDSGTTFSAMFQQCKKLKSVSMTFLTGLGLTTIFTNCLALTDVDIDQISLNKSHLSFSKCPLTVDSMVNIFNALDDHTEETTVYTITLGTDSLNKLTAEQKAIAINKNYKLA